MRKQKPTMDQPPPNPRGNDTGPQQALLAQTIWNTMNAGAESDAENWHKLENFVAAKARELRTEKLKRGHDSISPEQVQPTNYASRTILKIKKRK